MDNIRMILILAGALGIGALLVHGLWSLRRQQSGKLKQKSLSELYKQHSAETSDDDKEFDKDGVGSVRVVSGTDAKRQEPTWQASETPDAETPVEEENTSQLDLTLDEPEVTPTPVAETPVTDEDDLQPAANEHPEPEAEEGGLQPDPEEVLIMTVQARDNKTLSGAELLPIFLSLGLKFGEMGIFHRHLDPTGHGPVMFSLANMVNPGTFDLENMEQFTTSGITLFMTLPCPGNAQQAFTMMLNAAQKLAEELDAQVIDDTRSVLTQQKIRHYQERIREFERKKLLAH